MSHSQTQFKVKQTHIHSILSNLWMDVFLILLNSEYFIRVCTFYILYDFFYCNINFFILQINGIFRFVKLFRRNTFFTSRKNIIFLAERKTILKYGLIDTFFAIKH